MVLRFIDMVLMFIDMQRHGFGVLSTCNDMVLRFIDMVLMFIDMQRHGISLFIDMRHGIPFL